MTMETFCLSLAKKKKKKKWFLFKFPLVQKFFNIKKIIRICPYDTAFSIKIIIYASKPKNTIYKYVCICGIVQIHIF